MEERTQPAENEVTSVSVARSTVDKVQTDKKIINNRETSNVSREDQQRLGRIPSAESFGKSNGIQSSEVGGNSPYQQSDSEVTETGSEDVIVLDEDGSYVIKNGTKIQKSGSKNKPRKGPPPELLPIEQATSANGEASTARETPTRKAALKSAEITKIMSQIVKSKTIGEDAMAVMEVTMGLNDSDATKVTIRKNADPSINHCLNCNKMECLVYQTTGRYSKSDLNFCSKRCVQQYFKYGQIHYISPRDESPAGEQSADLSSSVRQSRSVQQDIVIEPDIQTAEMYPMDVSDDMSQGSSIGQNGASHGSIEAVIESAARESLTCHTCRVSLYDVTDPLLWEAMEFCSIKCLSYCVKTVGFSCNQCRSRVGITVLGKLCVRFGSSVRQFCSSPCLEKFKSGHKLCSQCQVNMSNKEQTFCSLACEDLHRRLKNKTDALGQRLCAVCNLVKPAREQISLHGQTHWLCSEPCRNAFRFAHKVTTLTCGLCRQLFDSKALPRHVSRNIEPGKAMELSDLEWFCSSTCYTTFLLKQRNIVSCSWCKVKKYNVDMIRKILTVPVAAGKGDQVPQTKEVFFCSIYCLDLHEGALQNVAKHQNRPNELEATKTAKTQQVPPVPNPIPVHNANPSFPLSNHLSAMAGHGATMAKGPPTAGPSTAPASTLVPLEVHHKIITMPAQPKEMKNKSTWCRPLQTETLDKSDSSTNDRPLVIPIPVPIPVPIYVPVPMGMYQFPCPIPFGFPIPIPAPVLLPVAPDRIADVETTVRKLATGQDQEPAKEDANLTSDPFEEEILLLAEALGNSAENSDAKSQPARKDVEEITLSEETDESEDNEDLEQAISSIRIVKWTPSGSSARKRTHSGSNPPAPSSPPTKRIRDAQRSSASSSEGEDSDSPVALTPFPPDKTGQPTALHGGFQREVGQRAWNQWIRRRSEANKTADRRRRLSSMNIDEMNAHLIEFVRDVRKPNGEKYRPDILLYFIYGLQLGLGSENRHEKLFMDSALEPFQAELDRCLEPFCQSLVRAISDEKWASFSSCLRESHLWDCQQLGVHTPFVLVFTMLYFNTKYFRLYTVEQHEQLSFTSVHKVTKKSVQVSNNSHGQTPKGSQKVSCLQLVHPTQQVSGAEFKVKKPFDQLQNLDRPTECPIKHYTFYLSKCPESVRTSRDVYYLVPETSCTPDSPVWYSTQPVPRQLLARMLRRVLLVEDVLQNLCV